MKKRLCQLCVDLPRNITNVREYVKIKTGFDVDSFEQVELEPKLQDIPAEIKKRMFNQGSFNRYLIKFDSKFPVFEKILNKKALHPCNVVYYYN